MTNTRKKVFQGTIIFTLAMTLSRVLGLFRDWLVARVGGTSIDADAYQLAFMIPDLMNHILSGGFLSITLVPLLIENISDKKTDQANRIFSSIFSKLGLVVFVLLSICWILVDPILSLLDGKNPETVALAIRYTRIILFGQIFFIFGGLCNAYQYAHYSYLWPALSGLIYNTSIIIGGFVSLQLGSMEGFCWGALIGAVVGNFVLQWISARKLGLRIQGNFNFKDPVFIRYVKLSMPFALGVGMSFSNELIYRLFPTLEGNISAMGYANRINMAVVAIFGSAVGVASYPLFTELSVKKKFEEIHDIIISTLSRIMVIIIPVILVLYFYARDVVVLLLQYGNFDERSVELTSNALQVYTLGAIPMSSYIILVRPFYADQRTWRPALLTLLCFVFTIAGFYFIQMEEISKIPSLSVFLNYFQFFALLIAWKLLHASFPEKNLFKNTGIILIAGGMAALVAWLIRSGLNPGLGGKMDALIRIIAGGGASSICFIILLRLVKFPPMLALEKRFLKKGK